MSEFTIIIDSREKKPFTFEDQPVDTKVNEMETGDYAVQESGYYGKNGVYKAPFAVERKAKGDFLSSITHERDRFERELSRADSWSAPMPIVVEAPWITFTQGDYYPNIHPNSIVGTVDKWPEYYNVDFFFRDNKPDAEQFTFEFLRWWNNQD